MVHELRNPALLLLVLQWAHGLSLSRSLSLTHFHSPWSTRTPLAAAWRAFSSVHGVVALFLEHSLSSPGTGARPGSLPTRPGPTRAVPFLRCEEEEEEERVRVDNVACHLRESHCSGSPCQQIESEAPSTPAFMNCFSTCADSFVLFFYFFISIFYSYGPPLTPFYCILLPPFFLWSFVNFAVSRIWGLVDNIRSCSVLLFIIILLVWMNHVECMFLLLLIDGWQHVTYVFLLWLLGMLVSAAFACGC